MQKCKVVHTFVRTYVWALEWDKSRHLRLKHNVWMIYQLLLNNPWACSCCSCCPLALSKCTPGSDSQANDCFVDLYKRSDMSELGIVSERLLELNTLVLFSGIVSCSSLLSRSADIRDNSHKDKQDWNMHPTWCQPSVLLLRLSETRPWHACKSPSKAPGLPNISKASFCKLWQCFCRVSIKSSQDEISEVFETMPFCGRFSRTSVERWLGRFLEILA